MAAKKSGKSAKKSGAKPAKKSAAKQKPAAKPAKKSAAKQKPPAKPAKKPEQKPAAAKAKVSSLEVNMGHVFALRPRVTTSFKPGDFSTAKHRLQDEAFADIQQAARAVAEKALELTRDGPGAGRHRRF